MLKREKDEPTKTQNDKNNKRPTTDNNGPGILKLDLIGVGEDEEDVGCLVLLAHDLGVLFGGLHGAQAGDVQQLGGLQLLEQGNNT